MNELVTVFQSTIFEMLMNERITDKEFNILEALTENIEETLDLIKILTTEDLKNEDITDCIIAKQFKTALLIVEG